MDKINYYQRLNVSPDASSQQIKEAFRQQAFKYHPDRNEGDAQAAENMKAVNEAYAVLSDPAKRRQYDMLYQQYGDDAQGRFRQSYSEQDIFKGSDVHQIFEEMARAFGLRGFDAIFKDFYGQGYRSFEFRQPGVYGKGVFFGTHLGAPRATGIGQRLFGSLTQKMLRKLVGIQLPERGADIHDVIELQPEFALQGGPYPYLHNAKEKKLVVHVPSGVQNGQVIRLSGMGQDGRHGAEAGDLLLKVKIKQPLMKKIKDFIKKGTAFP